MEDAKTEVTEEVTDGSSSTDQQLEPITDSDGLVSTMEYEVVEPVEETTDETKETDSKEETSSEKTETKTEDDTSKKEGFHDHPDWKAMIDKKNEYKSKVDMLEKEKAAGQEQKPNFNNIMNMEDDAIMDEFTDNPKQFLANFANQLFHEIGEKNTVAQQKDYQQQFKEKSDKTFGDFFADKKDGQAMLIDGRIEKFMQENPGHNAMSAYNALAGESQYESRIESAVKAEREKIHKELKAAGNANSFSSSTGGRKLSPDKQPEMKNPGKFGGTAAVLLKRFRERQTG